MTNKYASVIFKLKGNNIKIHNKNVHKSSRTRF